MDAVMRAEPGDTPVTEPVGETVATPGSLDSHDTSRPVRMLPAASLATAESCLLSPGMRTMDDGVTVTEAMGTGRTVMVNSLVAVSPAL